MKCPVLATSDVPPHSLTHSPGVSTTVLWPVQGPGCWVRGGMRVLSHKPGRDTLDPPTPTANTHHWRSLPANINGRAAVEQQGGWWGWKTILYGAISVMALMDEGGRGQSDNWPQWLTEGVWRHPVNIPAPHTIGQVSLPTATFLCNTIYSASLDYFPYLPTHIHPSLLHWPTYYVYWKGRLWGCFKTLLSIIIVWEGLENSYQ